MGAGVGVGGGRAVHYHNSVYWVVGGAGGELVYCPNRSHR